MRIGLLQLHEQKCSDGLRQIEGLLKREAELLILPEKWMPLRNGNVVHDDAHPFLKSISALSSDYGAVITTGALYEEEDGVMYITCYAYGPDGGMLAKQRKMHMFSVEKESFRPGDHISHFDVNGIRIGMAVCYDVDFPETIRKFALADCDMLAVPAKIRKEGAVPWMTYVQTRVLENRLSIAFANCSYGRHFRGGSSVVDLTEKYGIMHCRTMSIPGGESAAVFEIAPERLRSARRSRLGDRNSTVDSFASE